MPDWLLFEPQLALTKPQLALTRKKKDTLLSQQHKGIQGIVKKATKHSLNRFFLLLQRKKEEPELKK